MRGFLVALALLVFFGEVSWGKVVVNPIVTVTGVGSVKGSWYMSKWTSQRFAAFKDIPYAEETKRFELPQPLKPFEEEYDASFGKRSCMSSEEILQYMEYYDASDESCLLLSVFTKSLNTNKKAPVMFHVAGYNLEESSTTTSQAEYLLEEDVVLVTVQHRVGPFGFLSTQSEEIPGNFGVYDVIEALRWVKKYIKFFGGDEENITAFGQYKTAALIHVISMTQAFREEKLFQRMILQSGSALLDGISTEEPLEIAEKIGALLDCPVEDQKALSTCLKESSFVDLADAYHKYRQEHPRMPHFTVGDSNGLIESQLGLLAEYAEFGGVSVLGGVVKHPVVGLGALRTFKNLELVTNEFSSALLEGRSMRNMQDYKDIIKEKFPQVAFKDVLERALLPAVIDLNSLDIKDATSRALKYISSTNVTTYMYVFHYQGQYHWLKNNRDDFESIAMCDDNLYIFSNYENLNKKDKKMAKIMVKLWTTFATSGKPVAPGYVDHWPAVIKDTMGPYLKIDNIFEIGWNYPEEFFQTILESRKEEINIV